jgi:hypothetical protein
MVACPSILTLLSILAMNQMGQAGAMKHVIPVVIAQAIFGYEDDHHCQS